MCMVINISRLRTTSWMWNLKNSYNSLNFKKVLCITFFSFLIRSQCAKRLEASRIRKGFINSDGCNRKFPITNHLEDPFTVIPVILVRKINQISTHDISWFWFFASIQHDALDVPVPGHRLCL